MRECKALKTIVYCGNIKQHSEQQRIANIILHNYVIKLCDNLTVFSEI